MKKIIPAVAALGCLFCLKVFFAPHYMVLSLPGADIQSGYPVREMIGGGNPLWLKYYFCGYPIVAGIQAGVYYPGNLFFHFLSLPQAYNAVYLFHIILAGLGVALLLSELGVSALACVLGAASFMFSAAVVWNIAIGHIASLASLAWTGFIFWALLRLSRKPDIAGALLLGCFMALQLLAGHVQYFYMCSILVFLCSAGFIVISRRETGNWPLGFAACGAAAAVLAFLLSAPALLPFLEYAGHTARQYRAQEFYSSFAFPPENFLSLFMPEFFGSYLSGYYWGRWYPWEILAYCGAGGILLAWLALKSETAAMRRSARLVWVCAAAALVFAMGKYLPVFKLFTALIPQYDAFRCHGRFIDFFTFFLCIAAGIGADGLLKMEAARRRELAVKIAKVAAVMFAGFAVFYGAAALADFKVWRGVLNFMRVLHEGPLPLPDMANADVVKKLYLNSLWQSVKLLAVAGGLALALYQARGNIFKLMLGVVIIADMWSFGYKYLAMFDSRQLRLPAGVVQFLKRDAGPCRVAGIGINPAVFMRDGIECVNGYDATHLKDFQDYLVYSQQASLWDHQEMPEIRRLHPMLAMLNVQYVVAAGYDAPDSPYLKRVYSEGGVTVYKWTLALPRFYFTTDIRQAEHSAILPQLYALAPEPVAFIENPPPFAVARSSSAVCRISGISHGNNRLEFTAEAGVAGLLVVSDAFYPGWSAFVNGSPAEIYKVNYFVRGVFLRPGKNTVVMEFKPRSWRRGLWLALLASAAALLFIFVSGIRRRTNSIISSS